MEAKKFDVYAIENIDYGDGSKSSREAFIGSTVASTEKKAIANVKYRRGIRPSDLVCELPGDGVRRTTFKAVLSTN